MNDSGAVDLALMSGNGARPMFLGSESPLDAAQFVSIAHRLARQLPDRPAALNLCERRDNFVLAFASMLMRSQLCLLPPSRAGAAVGEVMSEHPGSVIIDDSVVQDVRAAIGDVAARGAMPMLSPERVVALGYTSGSTGRPISNAKTWRALRASAALNARRIRQALSPRADAELPSIVATVPPQHMYGLELSVLLPLIEDFAVHVGRPLYPADIAAALAGVPAPRILVTTPLHLHALAQSGIELPPLGVIVSATAPLTRELAQDVERRFQTTLLEFFGSTETCVIASRRTAQERGWRPYPGVTLRPEAEGTKVNAPWFPEEVLLQDVLELQDDGSFVVRGRNADMVEVGGKRASLADLTRRLLAVPGVSDAVVFQPDAVSGRPVQRLAALVVAEGLTEEQVLAGLATAMDPVFLPRPLLLVSRLPRNEVGKLPRDQLLAALKR